MMSSFLRRALNVRSLRPIRPLSIARNAPCVSSMIKYSYSTKAETDSQTHLKDVLSSEIKFSKTIPNELDSIYTDYISRSGFEIIESPGTSNVQLVKETEAGEKIRVFFDIHEVTDIPIQEDIPENDVSERVESLDSLLCNIKVLIENTSKNNGLFMNLFLQNSESSFMVDFITFNSDVSKFLENNVAKGEFIDNIGYQGPRFSNLDDLLQIGFESYLDSKGINDELAEFIISYSEFKEENEYRNWLDGITKFLE